MQKVWVAGAAVLLGAFVVGGSATAQSESRHHELEKLIADTNRLLTLIVKNTNPPPREPPTPQAPTPFIFLSKVVGPPNQAAFYPAELPCNVSPNATIKCQLAADQFCNAMGHVRASNVELIKGAGNQAQVAALVCTSSPQI